MSTTSPDDLRSSDLGRSSRSFPAAIFRDARTYRVAGQIVGVALVVVVIARLTNNLYGNLDRLNIPSDFDFIYQPTNFAIAENWGFDTNLPRWRMLLIGMQNTILAAGGGIILATILGTIIGIARLSSNWLVSKLSTFYVETLRNIPPLVVIVFFSIAIFSSGPFPVFREAAELKLPFSDTNWLILSNSRIGFPSFSAERNIGAFWILFGMTFLFAACMWAWRTLKSSKTGVPHRRLQWSLGVFVALLVLWFFLLNGPYDWSWPARTENGRRLASGFGASSAYLSVTLAVAMYTASHIAEIVRGAILAIHKGQGEAATALSLSSYQRYRFVIMPQAFRRIIPNLINQYLNLTKNTSLAVAVGYAELASLTQTSIGNGAPAPQSIILMMCGYLGLSLIISLIANVVNRSLRLKEQ